MAVPALDVTPGGASSNAYISEAAADLLLTDSRMHGTWSTLSSDDKKRAILWATRILDDAFDWNGAPKTTTQALRFPRSGLLDHDGYDPGNDIIPEEIEQGCAELALHLAEKDRIGTPALVGLGFSEAAAGSLKVKVEAGQVQPLVPQTVIYIVAIYGRLLPAAQTTGDGTVQLRRT